jgi:hypothetical protein
LLGGWFVFDSPDTALLVSLLPSLVHVRGVERLSTLVRLVGEEASERRAGRELVLTRLVEVLLIEALRATPGDDAPPGLLRGLADARLAPAIRQAHRSARAFVDGRPGTFSTAFRRHMGRPPGRYARDGWREAQPLSFADIEGDALSHAKLLRSLKAKGLEPPGISSQIQLFIHWHLQAASSVHGHGQAGLGADRTTTVGGEHGRLVLR